MPGRQPANQQQISDTPKRVNISLLPILPLLQNLRGNTIQRATKARSSLRHKLSKPEITNLDGQRMVQQDVLGLDVTMDYVLLVDCLEAFGGLQEKWPDL
jgi:hypothetical protein